MSDMSLIKTALPGYFSLTEAAQALGYVDGTYLRKLCQKGAVVSYKVGKTWFIPTTQVQALADKEVDGRGGRGQLRG